MDTNRVLSICIPTWNRTDMVVRAIEQIVADPRVAEIIVLDDASDFYIFDQLNRMLQEINVQDKIQVWANEKNLDCYANKAEALSLANTDWCILLDSDNVINVDYLNAIYSHEWLPDTFYCPEWAKPHFDYREFSGKLITKHNVHSHVGTKAFDCLINTANYFVNRKTYLSLFDSTIDPHAADTIFMNSRLLESGGKLFVVPWMRYMHTVHDQSHYKANHHKSDKLFKELREKLNTMR